MPLGNPADTQQIHNITSLLPAFCFTHPRLSEVLSASRKPTQGRERIPFTVTPLLPACEVTRADLSLLKPDLLWYSHPHRSGCGRWKPLCFPWPVSSHHVIKYLLLSLMTDECSHDPCSCRAPPLTSQSPNTLLCKASLSLHLHSAFSSKIQGCRQSEDQRWLPPVHRPILLKARTC